MEYVLFSAILMVFLCSLGAIFVALRVGVRVTNIRESFPKDLDWEQMAKLTGDVASLKRQLVATNNRMNGFESSKGKQSDAAAAVQALAAAQHDQRNISYLGG